jgi:hypothetical protein
MFALSKLRAKIKQHRIQLKTLLIKNIDKNPLHPPLCSPFNKGEHTYLNDSPDLASQIKIWG